MVYVGKEVECR